MRLEAFTLNLFSDSLWNVGIDGSSNFYLITAGPIVILAGAEHGPALMKFMKARINVDVRYMYDDFQAIKRHAANKVSETLDSLRLSKDLEADEETENLLQRLQRSLESLLWPSGAEGMGQNGEFQKGIPWESPVVHITAGVYISMWITISSMRISRFWSIPKSCQPWTQISTWWGTWWCTFWVFHRSFVTQLMSIDPQVLAVLACTWQGDLRLDGLPVTKSH